MATAKTTTPLDQARVTQIAQSIRGAVTPFLGANSAKVDAQTAANDASKAEVSLREAIMITVADLSQQGQWTESEVSAAAARAASMSNSDTEKSLATFIGETKRAMHPSVRAHVPALVNLRDLCWTSETEMVKADKTAPKPLRKAFARQYHMLIAIFGEAQSGRILTTAEDVMRFAEASDPDLDLDKVKARLDRIREQLAAFYHDWPVDDIQVCVDALNEIDKKALRSSRRAIEVVPAVVADSPQVIPAVVETDDEETYEVEHTTSAPAQGASDILSDILGETEAHLALAA